ncbi:diguanylate cyclase domain-containing protein [Inediibacterium massiliense]|uniref:diguanylate cyclase domain-containing protein n=1 Tax=Inediibacterium massiliense TaxID=1658111 RepID=UPI0006B67A87|nr:diguanylate cyclase [Inediibacterium massiliense]
MEKKFNSNLGKKIDLLDTIMITMFFILIIIFSYGGLNQNPINIFVLLFVMIGMLIGYYTNMTAAILYAILFDFFYASAYIFLNIYKSFSIESSIYFWSVFLPISTIFFAYKGKLIKEIQDENYKLKKENQDLVMIDRETGLRSSQSFFNDIQAYMNISKRYKVKTYLMLIQIKYEKEVIKILGESQYNKIIHQLSKLIDHILREEDKKYILRDMNLFGILFLSNQDGDRQVENRLREQIKKIDFKEETFINKINLEVIIGTASYDEEIIHNPYEFFKMAQKDMEYDV